MDDNKIFLTPRVNYVKDGDTIWTVLVKENVVVKCNVESDKAEAVAAFRFMYEGIGGKLGYWFVDKYRNKLFINLTAESNIRILDTDSLRWEKIEIDEDRGQLSREDMKFWTSFCHAGYYWKVGFSYPGILKIDIETNEVIYLNNWIEELKRLCNLTELDIYFGYGYSIRDNYVFLPVYCRPIIMKMDMSTFRCEFYEYPIKYKGFRVLSGDSNDIWAETISGEIVRIDNNMHLFELKSIKELSLKNNIGEVFWKPSILEDRVLFFPHFNNKIVEVDKNTMEVKLSKLNYMLPGVIEGKISCIETVKQDNIVTFFYMQGDGFGTYCEYDTENESIKTKRFLMEENDVQHTAWLLNLNSEIIPETNIFDLKSFVTSILTDV